MRIAIIEDNLPLLENLKLLLGGETGMTVVGAFGSAEDALKSAPESSPDIVLVDLGLPGMSGVEFIKQMKAVKPHIDIMVYSVFDDWDNVFTAIKAGATGYILKGTTPRELIEGITSLHQGGSPMSPKIARMVITELHDVRVNGKDVLSQREKEIVVEMDRGLTYKQISDKMHLSPHTVRTHIKNIYEKLQVKTKHDAIHQARRTGAL